MNIKRTLAFLIPVSLLGMGFYFKSKEKGDDILIRAIFENLQNMHFDPPVLDDEYSKKAFGFYLENLDNGKRFLLKSDVEALRKHELMIDDYIQQGRYDLMDEAEGILNGRLGWVEKTVHEILSKPFDFNLQETVDFGDDIPYAANENELKERWRQYLKYNTLTRLASYVQTQEDALNNKDTSYVEQAFDSLEAKARRMVLQNHDDWFKRMKKTDRKERMNIYINSLTAIFDPHTNYFPPADKDNFDIGITGRLEGIGARLQEKDGYISVVDVVPGGPAALQGELQAKDIILKVAQENEEAVSIADWKIDNAVKIIRGPKGSYVTLTVKRPDGSIKDIKIRRDVVVLEETYVKSSIMFDEDRKKMGYIYLPGFYTDFDGKGGRTSFRDVRDEIIKLKAEKVEGIVFDLRNNGGGSLQDVVDMVGLFIDKGPVVQIKSRYGNPYVMNDNNRGALWEGPLVVMVNEFSASASEIFAAALQDYKRAVIVGSHTTHGKGTVQRFINLNETLRNKDLEDLGAIKLTMQKFYRIDGGTTQLKGVTPDIIWPDNYTYIKTGEKEQDFPLKWDQIPAADYQAYNSYLNKLASVKQKSTKRTGKTEIFEAIDKNAKRWQQQNENDRYSLNLAAYRQELKQREEENKRYEDMFKPIDQFVFVSLKDDQAAIAGDSVKQKRADDWFSRLKKDIYLHEALQVAEDLL